MSKEKIDIIEDLIKNSNKIIDKSNINIDDFNTKIKNYSNIKYLFDDDKYIIHDDINVLYTLININSSINKDTLLSQYDIYKNKIIANIDNNIHNIDIIINNIKDNVKKLLLILKLLSSITKINCENHYNVIKKLLLLDINILNNLSLKHYINNNELISILNSTPRLFNQIKQSGGNINQYRLLSFDIPKYY